MVEGHPVGRPCAAVVADHVKSLEAEDPHDVDLVLRHLAEAVIG